MDIATKLQRLKQLHDTGLITEEEYRAGKDEILAQFVKTKTENPGHNPLHAAMPETVMLAAAPDKTSTRDRTVERSMTGKPAPQGAFHAGDVIDRKYKIVELLGEGGMGGVYRVEHLLLPDRKFFALKVLHPHLSQDPNLKKRFLREVQIAMEFTHENALQIREYGETEEGLQYFTMDFSPGISLKDIIATQGPIEETRALAIIRQILSALQVAHRKEILHRDLKPANIMVETRFGQDHALVLDFGIAKAANSGEITHITQCGVIGTPYYMSPEQATAEKDLDARSDIYSIGVILYEMVTGQLPFEGKTFVEILMARVCKDPLPPRAVKPDISEGMENIIVKALEKERDRRMASAGEFIEMIDRALAASRVKPTACRRSFFKRALALFFIAALIASGSLAVWYGVWDLEIPDFLSPAVDHRVPVGPEISETGRPKREFIREAFSMMKNARRGGSPYARSPVRKRDGQSGREERERQYRELVKAENLPADAIALSRRLQAIADFSAGVNDRKMSDELAAQRDFLLEHARRTIVKKATAMAKAKKLAGAVGEIQSYCEIAELREFCRTLQRTVIAEAIAEWRQEEDYRGGAEALSELLAKNSPIDADLAGHLLSFIYRDILRETAARDYVSARQRAIFYQAKSTGFPGEISETIRVLTGQVEVERKYWEKLTGGLLEMAAARGRYRLGYSPGGQATPLRKKGKIDCSQEELNKTGKFKVGKTGLDVTSLTQESHRTILSETPGKMSEDEMAYGYALISLRSGAPVDVRSDEAGIRYRLGLALLAQRRYPQAMEAFDAALAIDPAHDALVRRGDAHYGMKKYAGALRDWDQALREGYRDRDTLYAKLRSLAQEKVGPDILSDLAKSEVDEIRLAVAQNPQAASGTLLKLARDARPQVRKAAVATADTSVRLRIARHADTAADVLDRLARDPDVGVRMAVAGHASAPGNALQLLCQDPEKKVRLAVAANPKTSEDVMARMAREGDAEVRKQILSRPRVPPQVLSEIARQDISLLALVVEKAPAQNAKKYQDADYFGQMQHDEPYGLGKYTWHNGDIYLGQFEKGKPHGRGMFSWADGRKYTGQWEDGVIHGKGTLLMPDGSHYEGDLVRAKKQGQGIFVWADGLRYEGQYRNDAITGKGKMTWPNGNKYEGEFENGKYQGHGAYTLIEGEKYEGQYRDGKPHGRGTYTWPNGNRYAGEFLNGKFHGYGTLHGPDGKIIQQGIWVAGEYKDKP